MKRDMDLVRKILMAIESTESGWAPKVVAIEGATEEQIGFHVLLMMDAGLIVGQNTTSSRTKSPHGTPGRLTWAGYEFLDESRDPTKWDQAKAAATTVGGVSFDALKAILVGVGIAKAKAYLQIP